MPPPRRFVIGYGLLHSLSINSFKKTYVEYLLHELSNHRNELKAYVVKESLEFALSEFRKQKGEGAPQELIEEFVEKLRSFIVLPTDYQLFRTVDWQVGDLERREIDFAQAGRFAIVCFNPADYAAANDLEPDLTEIVDFWCVTDFVKSCRVDAQTLSLLTQPQISTANSFKPLADDDVLPIVDAENLPVSELDSIEASVQEPDSIQEQLRAVRKVIKKVTNAESVSPTTNQLPFWAGGLQILVFVLAQLLYQQQFLKRQRASIEQVTAEPAQQPTSASIDSIGPNLGSIDLGTRSFEAEVIESQLWPQSLQAIEATESYWFDAFDSKLSPETNVEKETTFQSNQLSKLKANNNLKTGDEFEAEIQDVVNFDPQAFEWIRYSKLPNETSLRDESPQDLSSAVSPNPRKSAVLNLSSEQPAASGNSGSFEKAFISDPDSNKNSPNPRVDRPDRKPIHVDPPKLPNLAPIGLHSPDIHPPDQKSEAPRTPTVVPPIGLDIQPPIATPTQPVAVTELANPLGKTVLPIASGTYVIANFGGVGRGVTPTAETISNIDILRFSGAGLTVENMILTQVGTDLVISFESTTNVQVTLKEFALDHLDNLTKETWASTTIGNILFNNQTTLSDAFDVVNNGLSIAKVIRPNTVTFLNSLDNTTEGYENSDDVINGAAGNDILIGLSGNDKLRGDAGIDRLYGNEGDDFLFGGSEDDLLNGGVGNDILNGGSGSDQFILDLITGTVVIQDFQLGKDSIRLPETMLKGISIQVMGSDTMLKLNDRLLATLQNVKTTDANLLFGPSF